MSLGKANHTAGTTFYPLKFVNKSKSSCTLRGYPGVSAVGKKGKQIGNAAKRIPSKYRTVTLGPGQAAELLGRDCRDRELLKGAVQAG